MVLIFFTFIFYIFTCKHTGGGVETGRQQDVATSHECQDHVGEHSRDDGIKCGAGGSCVRVFVYNSGEKHPDLTTKPAVRAIRKA